MPINSPTLSPADVYILVAGTLLRSLNELALPFAYDSVRERDGTV